MKTWSLTQSSPALSSCEAEYYAVVDGASRALGMQTAAKELGIDVGDLSVEVKTDSSGAKSFASRRGSGRIRHIEVKLLWLQQAVADGRFRMVKVPGKENPADILTKYKSLCEYKEQLQRVSVQVVGCKGSEDRGGGEEEKVGDSSSGNECIEVRGSCGDPRIEADGGLRTYAHPQPLGRFSWADAWEEENGGFAVRG